MKKTQKYQKLNVVGAILILIGALSIFPENDTWLHTTLQITFVVGCIVYLLGIKNKNKVKKSTLGLVLVVSVIIPSHLSAQDYTGQVKAFEASFHQKDITIIQPFLSDSLKFEPLPIQNTIPVLTNIITQLPKLNSIQIQQSENKKALVKYDFEQLGISESTIHFDADGMIKRIEFVENLIQQQIVQQRKMQSSVQAPQPDKVEFDYSKRTIEFSAKDGLVISADSYEIDQTKPIILLCHQAGYNKYEYADIAPRLNKMGFNALAIDQRSGGSFAGKENETNKRILQNGQVEIAFTDAIQDIESAIDYLSEKYHQKVIIWGSSYSSALALHIAENNKNVKAVISFSPGDYFGNKLPSLKSVIPELEQPFFLTSSKDESMELMKLLDGSSSNKRQIQFIPESEGFHGSRALWIGQEGADEYWDALENFLEAIISQ
jgi:alpha/beta superfamily hydrolase